MREGSLVGGQGGLETGQVSGIGNLVHLRGVELPHANQNLPNCWLLSIAILLLPHHCVFARSFCEKGVLGCLEHGGAVEGFPVRQSAAASAVRASSCNLENHFKASILFVSQIVLNVNNKVLEVKESVRFWHVDSLCLGCIDADAVDVCEVFLLVREFPVREWHHMNCPRPVEFFNFFGVFGHIRILSWVIEFFQEVVEGESHSFLHRISHLA